MSSFTLIVAATLSNGIGQGSKLPWRLSKDMLYFANATTSAPDGKKNVVIMGRKTWESIPPRFRPLKNRVNVIISKNTGYDLSVLSVVESRRLRPASRKAESTLDVVLTNSLQDAFSLVSPATLRDTEGSIHRRFIIGGASIYDDALKISHPPLVDRILLTRILSPSFDDCDVFFPEFRSDSGEWKQSRHDELQEWLGLDVPAGEQEEKGVKFEFQMWTRS